MKKETPKTPYLGALKLNTHQKTVHLILKEMVYVIGNSEYVKKFQVYRISHWGKQNCEIEQLKLFIPFYNPLILQFYSGSSFL